MTTCCDKGVDALSDTPRTLMLWNRSDRLGDMRCD